MDSNQIDNTCANNESTDKWQNDQDKYWMQQALNLAQKAEAIGEVPVGAILVQDNKIIGQGWNQPITLHDPTAHAEILAIRDAGKRIGNYRLPNTTLYCTLEPCPMCASAIINARIAQVVYGAIDPKGGACGSVFKLLPSDQRFNHYTISKGGVLADSCSLILQQFFQKRRNLEIDSKEKPTLQALLFDVDGTLVDNERDGHRVAFNQAFAEFDLDWYWSVELYGKLLQVTGGQERLQYFVDNWYPLVPEVIDLKSFITKLHNRKTAIYQKLLKQGHISLRPGISRLLEQARTEGLKLVIVTTTSLSNVESLLGLHLGPEAIKWFTVIAAGSQVSAKKPAPDIYQYALDQLKLPASTCMAFEDSAIGLQAARAAGITNVVITTTDYTNGQDFTGAKLVLNSLGDSTKPCRQIAGIIQVPEQIDLAVLHKLHSL